MSRILNILVAAVMIFLALGVTCPNQSMDVSVADGLIPMFSWSGGTAYRLRVVWDRYIDELPAAVMVWAIHTPGRNGLVSPIRYGEVPEGAELHTDTLKVGSIDTTVFNTPLIPNEKYSVQISRGYGRYAIGESDFVANP